jgi:hypothetical protein
MSDFCAGGLGPAIQSFVVFLITNIFAHAASIRLPSGTDTKGAVLKTFSAVFIPVYLGDHAFHIFGRWGRRMQSRVKRKNGLWSKIACVVKTIFPDDTIEDAAMAGAIAIRIPDRFTDVVKDSWERVNDSQKVVNFDRSAYSMAPEGSLFLLPPTIEFKENSRYSIPASSSIPTQLIAIAQLFLSSRQLYINFSGSIASRGLASPYLVVIPYLLMTFVNFVANFLVGSYSQILVLRAEHDQQRPDSRAEEGSGWAGERAPNGDSDQRSQTDFCQWLGQKYPSLTVSFHSSTQRRMVISRLISSLFLLLLQTLIIGLLTRFHVGITSHAVWFLIWLYGMAALRFFIPRAPKQFSLSQRYQLGLTFSIGVLVTIGVFGGVTVIVVELMEDMCQSDWSISARVWVIIGLCIDVSLVLCLRATLGFFALLGDPQI